MKKSTFLILLIVFVLSVVVVGIFGMKIMSYNVKVYIEEITPTDVVLNDDNNTTYRYYPNGNTTDKNQIRKHPTQANTYYVVVAYRQDLALIIDYEITPNDSTNRNLKITITSDSKGGVDGASVTESNSITLDKNKVIFKQKADVEITFRSTDGSNKTMKLAIYMQ